MSDDASDIPPALSAREWSRNTFERPAFLVSVAVDDALIVSDGSEGIFTSDVGQIAAIIALAYESLRRFDDPRAFLRKQVATLRRMQERMLAEVDEMAADARGDAAQSAQDDANDLGDLADALDSMLPPARSDSQ